MSNDLPPFQEASQCDVCSCTFNTFRRRHHCRRCGRSLCAEHSSSQMALPQFGIYSNVRVCSRCFDGASRITKGENPNPLNGVNRVTEAVSRLDISATTDYNAKPSSEAMSTSSTVECKCGMPLCICESPAPSKDEAVLQKIIPPTSSAQSFSKPMKKDRVQKTGSSSSTSSNNQFMNFNVGQVTSSSSGKTPVDYEVNGEGLREAIKNDDTFGVKELLSKGVDANYLDKQGSSLLHLAAVFNRTDICFALMEYGAKLDSRNPQGETPLDCAPETLRHKMRTKMADRDEMK